MSELSSRARELARSGRGAFRPTAAERARVDAALRVRLGAAAFSGVAVGAAGLFGLKRWLWPSVSILVVAAIGGALFVTRGLNQTAPTAASPPTAPSAPAPRLPAPAVAPTGAAPAELTPSPAVTGSAPAASRRDRLAEEVAMLSRATGLLNAGRASEALRALEEHQRRFPSGALTEERRGARAQALCTLGMRAEAEKELARLARSSPSSPHLAQARKLCGAPRPEK